MNNQTKPTLEDMTDSDALLRSANACASGVRWKASVQRFEIDKLRWLASIRKEIENQTFKGRGFKRFDIVERGKLRHIQSVHISERVVQKLLCNEILKPVVYPRLIYDNTASQEGKGTELALKRLVEISAGTSPDTGSRAGSSSWTSTTTLAQSRTKA